MDIYEDISDEIEGLLDEINPEKALINQKKSEFEKLKANITLEKGEERLQSLLKLRDELLLKINSSN
jgi:archaellum component FlaC